MRQHKKSLVICMAACSLLLGGCGEPLHELTAEEEDLIVHYSAYVLAKHNIQQKDGMSSIIVSEEDIYDDDDESETKNEETNVPVEDTGISLAEAIGHGSDLSIVYTGSYVTDNYIEGSVYSIDAAEGKTFYIMKFLLTNITDKEVEVENVTKEFSFYLKSGDLGVKSKSTFLMSDFSTYYGTISPKESVEAILLFEVSEKEAGSITTPSLQIIINEETKKLKM